LAVLATSGVATTDDIQQEPVPSLGVTVIWLTTTAVPDFTDSEPGSTCFATALR
jgi:hypothetical protein